MYQGTIKVTREGNTNPTSLSVK